MNSAAGSSAVFAVVNDSLCAGCGCCVTACASKAIALSMAAEIDAQRCTGCGQCEALCPTGAITLQERKA